MRAETHQIVRLAAIRPVETMTLGLLTRLPEPQREAIRVRMLDDQEYPEVAPDVQCSEAVVRQRVSRGPRTLLKGLEQ
jgi:DNA-directed RNA polymerase specialized sigma24 family protein